MIVLAYILGALLAIGIVVSIVMTIQTKRRMDKLNDEL